MLTMPQRYDRWIWHIHLLPKDSWILDVRVETSSLHLFIVDYVCVRDMGCKVYLSELVLIISRHCWKQITLPESYEHYLWQIHLPCKMTKGSWIMDGRVETPSQHLFFNADVCETCRITKKYIYLHASPKTKYYLILVLHTWQRTR